MDSKERKAGLKALMASVEEKFGKGALITLSDTPVRDESAIPTGSIALDMAIGIGGLPRGCIMEIYGPESSGKTTLTLSIIAQCQKAGGVAAFIDAEHAMDPEYSAKCGIDIKSLLFNQPDNGEQGLDMLRTIVASKAVDLVVIDSLAALVPKAEIEGEIGDQSMGLQARMMSQSLRMLCPEIAKSGTAVIFINQLREKIGVMFGSPETTPGGKAMKYYAHVRLDVRRKEPIKKGDEVVGNILKIKVVKNKVAPPFREAMTELLFGRGINREGDLLALGVERKIVGKAGAHYTFGGKNIGNGKDASQDALRADVNLATAIDTAIRKSYEVPAEVKTETKPPAKA